MVEQTDTDRTTSRWPARRRFAWTALFLAILGWSSLLQPARAPEVLNWSVTVPA